DLDHLGVASGGGGRKGCVHGDASWLLPAQHRAAARCRQCRKRRYPPRVVRRITCYRFVSRSLSAETGRRHGMDSSGRLLVVDDDPTVRAMLVEYLSGHRYEVRAAESGAEMRVELERDLPDLVLLDIRLPGE